MRHDQPAVESADPPPLRIHHLLACAVVAAAMMTLNRAVVQSWLPELTVGHAVYLGIHWSIQSVGVTAAVFAIYWQLKGMAGLVQPGQWLLLSYPLTFATWVVLWSVRSLRYVAGPSIPWSKNILAWGLADFASVWISFGEFVWQSGLPFLLLYAWGAWRIADTRPWRFLYALVTLGCVAVTLQAALSSLSPWFGIRLSPTTGTITTWPIPWISSVAVLALLAWAVVDDVARRRRNWTHWLGCTLWATAYVLMLTYTILRWFLWS